MGGPGSVGVYRAPRPGTTVHGPGAGIEHGFGATTPTVRLAHPHANAAASTSSHSPSRSPRRSFVNGSL